MLKYYHDTKPSQDFSDHPVQIAIPPAGTLITYYLIFSMDFITINHSIYFLVCYLWTPATRL